MKDFIDDCKRTESPVYVELSASRSRLLHAAMGMVTEAGEFMDALKKHIFYGKELDKVNLAEELGDIMWYQAIAMDVLRTTFPQEAERVLRKLQSRYPEKFDAGQAINRNLTKERSALERS